MRVRPLIPQTARDSMAFGVFCMDAARMASAIPGSSRSITAFVASGVTSLGETPVPPVARPELTPTERFYRSDINLKPPSVDAKKWRLAVGGMVDAPLSLTLEDVEAVDARQRALMLDDEMLKTCRFEGIVGRSPLMIDVFAKIRRAAPHFKSALVTGATGSGKELVARALHRLSPVAGARFAVCNCSAIVETLFESELFGHVKGAFTGATGDKVGLFEYAAGGTVFLDEIGDLPSSMQTKLLRVLERDGST